jgi:hypothetical protein
VHWRSGVGELEGWAMKTVVLDFDGVIHRYSRGWQEGRLYDPPTDGCQRALARLSAEYRLVVVTSRDRLAAVRGWLAYYGLEEYIEEVTNRKPPAAAYVDDRAVVFRGGWDETISGVEAMTDGGPWCVTR